MDSANGFGYYKASVYSSDLSPNHFISPKQLVIRDSNDDINNDKLKDFIYSPQNAIYRAGDEDAVIFECVPRYRVQLDIKWTIDGIELYNNSIVSIIYAQRRLEIKSAHLLTNSDEAVIKCQIIFDPYGDKYSTTIANLTIIKRPEINRKLLPNKISKEVGESLSLNCQASGVPKPFLQWYFNGDRLGINGSHLHIENLDSINFGLYQCEASNAAGVDLTITWLRKVNESTSDSLSFPKIVEFTGNFTAYAMTDVKLKCLASGNPLPTINWSYNGWPVILYSGTIKVNKSIK